MCGQDQKQKNLVTLTGNAKKTYKEEYDEALNQLTPAQRKKYQSLIESNTEYSIEDFEGEKDKKIFDKIAVARSAWDKYQQSKTDNSTAKQNLKDTKKQILSHSFPLLHVTTWPFYSCLKRKRQSGVEFLLDKC